jgi:hypothetical protein
VIVVDKDLKEMFVKMIPFMQAVIEADLSEMQLVSSVAALGCLLCETTDMTIDDFKQKLAEISKVSVE